MDLRETLRAAIEARAVIAWPAPDKCSCYQPHETDCPQGIYLRRTADAVVQFPALLAALDELDALRTEVEALRAALRNLWRVENGDIGAGMKRAEHMESARKILAAPGFLDAKEGA